MSDETFVTFKKAVRQGSHVLIAMFGESGDGKTMSALKLARGLVGATGRIAGLDTENNRMLVYANEIDGWDHAELTAPHTPERYIEAIKAADAAGYDALILDSASAEWEGLGGLIDIADATGKQGLLKWMCKVRHKKFVRTLLATKMHVIICMRAKEKMKQTKNAATGKEEIISDGYFPVQEKRFIYDMTVQLFMHKKDGKSGFYKIDKCPGDLLGAFPDGQQISEETGRLIAEWVKGGAPIDHELLDLKMKGEEEAERGMAALTAWHKTLTKEQVAKVWPIHGANMKSIAKTADDDRAAADIGKSPGNPFVTTRTNFGLAIRNI